jgi:thioredoxin reductase (NADPH)
LSDTKREIPAEYVPTADQRAQVWLLARRGSLEATMSYYLVERIKAQPNIEVLTRSEVTGRL